MDTQSNQNRAANLVMSFVGVALTVFALLLSIAVVPMLLFARDSRDMTGGIAGGILILLMGLTGIVLVFREKTPPRLMRAFHLTFGGFSILAGVAIIGSAVYELSQGEAKQINRGVFGIPILFIGMGCFWFR